MAVIHVCKDHGRPGCLLVADPAYTMRFDDIGEKPIYWCSHCGAEAQAITEAINNAFKTRPGFAEQFKDAIDKAVVKQVIEG